MTSKSTEKPKLTAADRARHKAVREEFENAPTQETLAEDSADSIKLGAYFAVKLLVHELKTARQAAGLTLAAVSKITGMDQATLSRLESGKQVNPTVDTLWRYASAVGRKIVLTHEAGRTGPTGSNTRTKPRRRGAVIA
jgi:DNA-binding XRE family transcriptional regulator